MMHFSKYLIAFSLLFCSLAESRAQFWEYGASGGAAFYHGDLAPDFSMQLPGPAFSFHVRNNLDQRVAIRWNLSYGFLSASDKNSRSLYKKNRNLSFQTNVLEGSMLMEFNFLPYHYKKKGSPFSPYLVAGFGVFRFRPKAYYGTGLYDLQSLGTEGQPVGGEYNLTVGNFILGFGFKVDISRRIAVIIEGSTRLTFTDYLDDVSGAYANPKTIQGSRGALGGVAVALADPSTLNGGQRMGYKNYERGNPNTKDRYTFITVGINYTIWQLRCPAYSR